MKFDVRPLLRGLILILIIAAILLFSDRKNRGSTPNETKLVWTKNPGEIIEIDILLYNDSPVSEETQEGFIKGFSDLGWVGGKDYKLQTYNAQGDIGTLNTIVESVSSDPPDIIFTATTPVLQAVSKKIDDIPIFFATVADPVAAGIGADFSHHLHNVTGISTMSPFDEMMKTIKIMMPNCKTLGTIFCPVEANSVAYEKYLKSFAAKHGMSLVSVPANNTSDVADAALSLVNSDIDAVCQLSDNLTGATYAYIIQSAEKKGLPYFSFAQSQADKGAVLTIARDYRQAGTDAVMLSEKFMRGTPVKDLPFQYVSKTIITINNGLAKKHNLHLSPETLRMADKVIE